MVGGDGQFRFATFGGLIGKVSTNSVHNTHTHSHTHTFTHTHTYTHTHTHSLTYTHTHTHTHSLPRLVTTITGNPHHSGFLSCSGLGILYLGAWILHSWRQVSLRQPCPCILCCLVLAAVLELNRPYTGKSWHVSLLETKLWVCMAYLGGDSQIKKGHKEVEEWARKAHIEQVTSVNHWSVNLLGISSSQYRAPLPALTSPGDWQLPVYIPHCDPSLVEHCSLWGVISLGLPAASNTRWSTRPKGCRRGHAEDAGLLNDESWEFRAQLGQCLLDVLP